MTVRGWLASVLILSACGAPPVPPAPLPTVDIQASVVAGIRATQQASDMAVPTRASSPAPAPSLTTIASNAILPPPTATPVPPHVAPTTQTKAGRWTSLQVIEAFKAAGLEVGATKALTREDYGMAPLVAVEATRFLIPSLCAEGDCGGRVFTFANEANRDKMKEYYDRWGRESAALFSHTFVRDNILIQINGVLTDEKAKRYEDALKAMN